MVDSLDFLFLIVMQGSDSRPVKLNLRGWKLDLGIPSWLKLPGSVQAGCRTVG